MLPTKTCWLCKGEFEFHECSKMGTGFACRPCTTEYNLAHRGRRARVQEYTEPEHKCLMGAPPIEWWLEPRRTFQQVADRYNELHPDERPLRKEWTAQIAGRAMKKLRAELERRGWDTEESRYD